MRHSWLFLVVVLAGCGGHGSSPDAAALDGRPDSFVGPIEAGPCGADQLVAGALVDLDSTTSQLVGVSDARFTLQGMPATTTTTASNGGFEVCAAADSRFVFDVDAPAGYLDGFAYIQDSALHGFGALELRSFTATRATAFYAQRGLVFDANRAHVLVFVAGDRVNQSLDRPHGATQAANDDDLDGVFTWAAGTSGRYVLFPNVDVTSPTATLSDGVGPSHSLPIAAGKLTVAATYFVFI